MSNMFYTIENEFGLFAFREDLKRVGYQLASKATRKGNIAESAHAVYRDYNGIRGEGIKIYTRAKEPNKVNTEIWIYPED